jgi:hypothetical protein
MTKFVSFLAIAFVLSISSAEADKKKTSVATASAPVQKSYPKRGNKAWVPSAAGCRMSGRC